MSSRILLAVAAALFVTAGCSRPQPKAAKPAWTPLTLEQAEALLAKAGFKWSGSDPVEKDLCRTDAGCVTAVFVYGLEKFGPAKDVVISELDPTPAVVTKETKMAQSEFSTGKTLVIHNITVHWFKTGSFEDEEAVKQALQ